MTWVWVVAATGLAIFVAARVAALRVRPRMDRVIRSGGFTADQVETVSRMVFRRGTLPTEPKLRNLGIVIARQGAQNFAVTWWDAPLTLFALDLMSLTVILTNNLWLLLVPLALAALTVQAAWRNRSGLSHARAITKANPAADV